MTDLEPTVIRLAEALQRHRWKIATAESCTGGLIAAACTAVAGSSAWFERGFVTYSNEAKVEMLGVDAALIAAQGAVSEAVALAMAEGSLRHSAADLAVAVTGVAGPGGGTAAKPVGTVWLAIAQREQPAEPVFLSLRGDRSAVRAETVARALALLLSWAQRSPV